MSLFKEIRREVLLNYLLDSLSIFDWVRLLSQPKTWGIILFRMAGRGSGIARRLLAIGFHSEIGNDIILGHSLWLPHPYGIVMAQGTKIGNNCSIFHRTTFAEKGGGHQGPTVGTNCIIGTGVRISRKYNGGE